jgi:peroxiredoxin
MIKVADTLPSLKLMAATAEGPREISTEEVFKGKKVVMFAVPGAFTPTCSAKHLPGFNEHLADFRAKGVDTVVCMAVNDAFVLGAWAKSQDISPDIVMLADGSGQFTRALGLDLDLTQRGLGVRSQRRPACYLTRSEDFCRFDCESVCTTGCSKTMQPLIVN